jgi:hypothetical protein
MSKISWLVALFALATSANAAEINVSLKKDNKTVDYVYFDGDIVEGDFDKFKKFIGGAPNGQRLILNSDGGLIVEAIKIGELVRAKKFLTVAGDLCASACALIWLAGVERAAYDTSRIGFHSAYNTKTGQVSGSANAIVGAYLSRLGYSYTTIHYATKVGPESMEWLSISKACELGIPVMPADGELKTRPDSRAAPFRGNAEKEEDAIPSKYFGIWCWVGNDVYRKCAASSSDRVIIDTKNVNFRSEDKKESDCRLLELHGVEADREIGRFECTMNFRKGTIIVAIELKFTANGKLSVMWESWKSFSRK